MFVFTSTLHIFVDVVLTNIISSVTSSFSLTPEELCRLILTIFTFLVVLILQIFLKKLKCKSEYFKQSQHTRLHLLFYNSSHVESTCDSLIPTQTLAYFVTLKETAKNIMTECSGGKIMGVNRQVKIRCTTLL